MEGSILNESINENIKKVVERLEHICGKYGMPYTITGDDVDRQVYLIQSHRHHQDIKKEIQEFAEEQNIHVEIQRRKDGILYSFTLKTISDGHWRPLSKERKREEFSSYSRKEDAKCVRRGDTLANQGEGQGDGITKPLNEALDIILEEYNFPTVAIDLDNTLAKPYKKFDNNHIPDPKPGAKKAVDELKAMGARVIIFTVRGNTEVIKKWCHKHDINYDYINENPDQPSNGSGKVIADIYIDDRAESATGSWADILKRVKKRLTEDQYKFPSRKRKRDFSAYPSSFGKSKTFGGITESTGSVAAASVCGSSIPAYTEPSANYGLQSAARSTAPGEPREIKPKKLSQKDKRKDLTDALDYDPLELMDKSGYLSERTLPTARAGRVRDDSKRSIITKKVVPSVDTKSRRPSGDDGVSPFEMEEAKSYRDDVAARERRDPYSAVAKKLNMRPLGVFGPKDERQLEGGPVSNVTTTQAPDRSPGAKPSQISVKRKKPIKNPAEGETVGLDPLNRTEEDTVIDWQQLRDY